MNIRIITLAIVTLLVQTHGRKTHLKQSLKTEKQRDIDWRKRCS